jgi:putative sugar O-methyltransferase
MRLPKGPEVETTGTPSRFWQRLAREHSDQLERHGLGEMKRQQALRYFTWQWRWKQVLRSEQFRFLLRETPWAEVARAVATPQPLSPALWSGLPWGVGDRWLYTLATRLLWRYAERHGDPNVLALGEPALGNPPPVVWRGRLVSQDLANSSLEVEAIRRALGGRGPASIMEIGGGYGRTAYSLLGVFPQARYTIVDIEPALSLARFYLSSLYPNRDIVFIEAGSSEIGSLGGVELAVSISSLHEMTPAQVATYLQLLDQVVTDGGVVFLKQWERWHNPVDDVVMRFDDYPVPLSWARVFRETSPVQTRFVQAAWRLGAGR